MRELQMNEIDEINGGFQAKMFLVGFAAGVAGTAIAVAGLGTPISMGGAVLGFEGAAMMSLALAM
jgi:hypothetical protein